MRRFRSDRPNSDRPDVEATDTADGAAQEAATQDRAAQDAATQDDATQDEASQDEASRNSSPRRRRALVVAGALVLAMGAGGGLTAAAHKSIELDVDGQIHEVSTFSRDIEALLQAEGIELAEHDLVVPSPDEQLHDGAQVVVRSAQQIAFQIDGQSEVLWTTALSADEALQHLSASGRDVALTASRSDGRAELAMPVTRGASVQIEVDGEQRTVQPRGAADLAGVLRLAEINLNPMDRLALSVNDGGTAVLTVNRVETREDTRTEAIEHESVERETSDLYRGQSRVVQEGSDGERTYTMSQIVVDGEVESSKHAGSEVTTEAEDRIVEVGTAERPAPPPAPRSSGSGGGSGSSDSSGSSSGSGSSGSSDSGDSSSGGGGIPAGVWSQLAQCESGGNPTIVSSNGLYHGLFQFSVATWQSVGGSGLPSQASPEEQLQRAQALQARSGWGQWPACSRSLGLR